MRLAWLLGLIGLVAQAATPKYNLVAIVTDDQATWTLGSYGGREIPTPHLDRLASTGVRFPNAFVHTPVCSPSRGSYLTGLLGTELGYTDWLNDEQARHQGVKPALLTWPEILQQNGYVTGLIGKWHLGLSPESRPVRNGFTTFTGHLSGGWDTRGVRFLDESDRVVTSSAFSVEFCTEVAMRFVDASREKPFALLLHYREPHAAYVPMPAPDMEASRNADIRVPDYPGLKKPYVGNQRRAYYASIAALDRQIGRLLDHLDQRGLSSNTVVLFTSDHGYNIGEHGIQHKGNGFRITEDGFRDSRPNMFDSSLRVPLIVRHPAATSRGGVVETWVANSDTPATVLGLLGIDRPDGLPARSRDFSPAVCGGRLDAATFPSELFGQYDLVNNPVKARMRMFRNEDWKLILFLDDLVKSELYHLKVDPDERTNLYADPAQAATVRALTARIRREMEAIKDPRLPDLPAG